MIYQSNSAVAIFASKTSTSTCIDLQGTGSRRLSSGSLGNGLLLVGICLAKDFRENMPVVLCGAHSVTNSFEDKKEMQSRQ